MRAYLEKNSLKCAVAFDANGEVGSLYSVDSIPQTVIIGRDGIVAAVHGAVERELKPKMIEEIEAVLGKSKLAT